MPVRKVLLDLKVLKVLLARWGRPGLKVPKALRELVEKRETLGSPIFEWCRPITR